jgi:hypothetical protein
LEARTLSKSVEPAPTLPEHRELLGLRGFYHNYSIRFINISVKGSEACLQRVAREMIRWLYSARCSRAEHKRCQSIVD